MPENLESLFYSELIADAKKFIFGVTGTGRK
jgi:hypothetical protein